MKKAVVFALTGIMAVSMFGCGSKKQVEVSSVDDLKDLTIGVQTGTTGDSYASDAVASDSQMKRYNKGADAIQALKTGKIDAVVIDSLPAQKFVEDVYKRQSYDTAGGRCIAGVHVESDG